MGLVCLGLCLLSSTALADPPGVDPEKGRELAGEAMKHYGDAEYQEALDLFTQAEKVYPAAQVLRMKGYTLIALERWLEAAKIIESAIEADYKPLLPRDAEHAEDQLKVVFSHLAMVRVTSNASDAKVTIDGSETRSLPAELRLLPGVHRFLVEAPGHEPEEQQRTLQAGEVEVAVDLRPIPKPTPKPKKPGPVPEPEPAAESDIYGWFPYQGPIGLSVAGAGLVLGGIALGTGIHGLSLQGAVQDNIDAHNQNFDPACRQNSDLCHANIALINEDGQRAADLQDVGLVTGIVGASLFTVGAVLFFFSDDSPFASDDAPADDQAAASWSCTPGGGPSAGLLACGGRF